MKFLIKILFFLVFIFIGNIIFYYISDDYKHFLEGLKYNDNIKNDLEENIDDLVSKNNIDIDNKNNNNTGSSNNLVENNIKDNIINNNLDLEENKTQVVLGKNYIDILNKFKKIYNLDKIEVNTVLFEITNEYPDYYYEYYSPNLTLYFFTTKNYTQIYDIFNFLQLDGPFVINEVNNFGEKSFYINLNTEVNDSYIRLVISENGITYGLKIKNSDYDIVKNILLNK